MLELSKETFKKLFLEYSISLIIIFLFLGLFFRSGLVFPACTYVGDYFLEGGVMALLVYWLLGRHEKYVLRREILGIGEHDNLLERLGERSFEGYHQERVIHWKLDGAPSKKWSAHWIETFHIRARREAESIYFSRTYQSTIVRCRVRHGKGDWLPVTAGRLAEPMSPGIIVYQLIYKFEADKDYFVEIETTARNKLSKDSDFNFVTTTIPCHLTKLSIEFPSGVDLKQYDIHAFLHDLRWRKLARQLTCKCQEQTVTVEEEGYDGIGPLLSGEGIFLRYVNTATLAQPLAAPAPAAATTATTSS
jgi:hypothetical protein